MITATEKDDRIVLHDLNARFIQNFVRQDAAAHDRIIHKDFVCIESSGAILNRDEYIKGWSHAYEKSGYTSFQYVDESIRIFGDLALIRAKTVYTKAKDGITLYGNSVYTDTYVKENGQWLCVQAQITPVNK